MSSDSEKPNIIGVFGWNVALWQKLWVAIFLTSRCVECCANDACLTSFQATLTGVTIPRQSKNVVRFGVLFKKKEKKEKLYYLVEKGITFNRKCQRLLSNRRWLTFIIINFRVVLSLAKAIFRKGWKKIENDITILLKTRFLPLLLLLLTGKWLCSCACHAVRSDAEEHTFWGARLDVLIFRLRSYRVLISHTADCNVPTIRKTLMFLGQGGTFLSFQARRSSATRSSTSDLTVVATLFNYWYFSADLKGRVQPSDSKCFWSLCAWS